jgi:hypothetical protein
MDKRFKDIVTGTFKIVGFDLWHQAKVILEKDNKRYNIYLSRLQHQIIGKSEIEATLYLTQSGNWVIGPARNQITVKENGRWITREKKAMEDSFEPISQYSRGRSRAKIHMSSSNGQRVVCHLHDIFHILPKIYAGEKVKLVEQKKGQVLVWIPVE